MIKQRNKHVRLIVTLLLITVVMVSVPSVFAVTAMSQDVYDSFPNTESNRLTEADDGVPLDAIDSEEGVEFAEPPKMETEDAETFIAAVEIPELSEDDDVTLFAASEIVASGACGAQGDNLTWTLDSGGVLTISGTGNMCDYENWGSPWYGRKGDNIKKIIIQDGVTSIGNFAFECVFNVTDIEISNSVTAIGNSAFSSCQKLKNIVIPEDSIKSIGIYAFDYCLALTSIQIPNGVESIGSSAFSSCGNLSRIEIPASVVDIDARCICETNGITYFYVDENNPNYSSQEGVLFNKDGTELLAYAKDKAEPNYTVPDGVQTIQLNAFQNCRFLTNVKFPNTLEILEWSSFSGCVGLTKIELPNSIRQVSAAFSGCENLSEIIVDRAQCVVPSVIGDAPNATVTYLRNLEIDTIAHAEYTGQAITPPVTITEKRKDGTASTVFYENKDYSVYYSNNTNAGTAKITIYYTNDYAYIVADETNFEIKPKACNNLLIAPIPNQACTGRKITPDPTIKDTEIQK